MASQTRFRLKVLSGPQTGAEMLLSDGRRLIGRDDACDILLADDAVAPQHAALVIERGQCSIEALEGALVVVDGRRVTQTVLRPFQLFTLGATHLAAGPADQPWPHIDLPASGSAAPTPEPEPAPAAAVAAAAKPVAPVAAAHPPRPRRRSRLIAALVALAGVVLIAVVLLLNGSGSDTPAPSDRQAQLAAVEQQLKGLLVDYQTGTDLHIERADDHLTVRGYVPTAEARKQLRSAIEKVSPAVEVRVSDTASLAEAARSIITMYKLELTAAPGEPGEVVVEGTTGDAERWIQVKQTIATDVPRIARLTDHVNQPAATPAAEPVPAAPQPVAAAAQTPPQPRASAVEATPALPPPPVSLAIQSINVGSSRWMVLAGGERVFVGGQLGSGYVVTSIEPDQVVLARNGQETVIRVGADQ